ncbi:hypothetical protein, partial [Halorubrum miltondacostae]
DSAESIHGNLAHVSVVSDFVTNPLQREYEFTAGETIRMDVDVDYGSLANDRIIYGGFEWNWLRLQKPA